jgi:glycosyltransferase involved in cell wall biosynthesis
LEKKLKICIFPNDPLIAYYNKGEIKDRYYNPGNFFDEVHFITLTDQDIEAAKIQKIAGKAKIVIHSVGKINIKNRKKYLKKIIELCRKINPDIIRAFNPYVEGWLAANCAQKLDKPFFVSLHTQYDYNRKLVKKKNLKKFLALKYLEKFIEPFVLRNADKITIVYKIIEPYVSKHTSKIPELLYNKIDCEKFYNAQQINELSNPLILSVGNLIESKNHKLLIKSMQNIDANLLIIGKGELYESLKKIIKIMKLENKITILESVPYEKITSYYKTADIFALAYDPNQEGLPMPVMEAMASGTPVIVPESEDSKELEDSIIFAKRNVEEFTKKIDDLLRNKTKRDEYSMKCIETAKRFDISKLEKREAEIYQELIKNGKTT